MRRTVSEQDWEGHDFSRAEEDAGSSTAPDNSRSESSGLVGMTVNDNVRGLLALGSKGVNELQFRIKDQDYFLAFVEDEKRWYVIAPTPQGVHRIPVYVDAANWGTPVSLATETTLSS